MIGKHVTARVNGESYVTGIIVEQLATTLKDINTGHERPSMAFLIEREDGVRLWSNPAMNT